MTFSDDDLLPEQRARVRIVGMLAAAGWIVQDYKAVNLYAGAGGAVRELVTNAGPADYVLFVNRQGIRIRVPEADRQKKLADEIEEALRARGLLEVELSTVRRRGTGLRRSILEAAFGGRLVAQDPGDEPASVLLDRIRNQRAAITPTRRARTQAASQ